MADQPDVNQPTFSMNIDNQIWDAVVVGAGPAGCAAAYDLATAGLSVLLLDKSHFPRPKACAGGLTAKAVKALRYSIDPVVRQEVRRIALEDGGMSTSLKNREPICVMTVRAEFDEYCLGKTLAAGARFARVSALRQIIPAGNCVHLLAAGETYRARFLVGADGASGPVRPLCGQGSWFSRGFALEVQTPMPHDQVDLTFDFAAVSKGYGWIFPKGDHLNLGMYSLSSDAGLTRSGLLKYVEQRTGTDRVDHVTGQYLGIGAGGCETEYVQPQLRDRVLLVGDAGGFVDPLTGEGIYGALVSGQAAATAILSATRGEGKADGVFARALDGYRQTLRFSARAAEAFYKHPARGFRAMRMPLVRRTMVQTYTQGLNINSLAMRIALSRC